MALLLLSKKGQLDSGRKRGRSRTFPLAATPAPPSPWKRPLAGPPPWSDRPSWQGPLSVGAVQQHGLRAGRGRLLLGGRGAGFHAGVAQFCVCDGEPARSVTAMSRWIGRGVGRRPLILLVVLADGCRLAVGLLVVAVSVGSVGAGLAWTDP